MICASASSSVSPRVIQLDQLLSADLSTDGSLMNQTGLGAVGCQLRYGATLA